MQHKLASESSYTEFPRLEAQIAENPARWLDLCDDGVTRTVKSLLDGMESLERARNWQYVSEYIGVSTATRDAIESRVHELETRNADRKARVLTHQHQEFLREVYHTTVDERKSIIVDVAQRDHEAKREIVALANQLNDKESQTTSKCEHSSSQSDDTHSTSTITRSISISKAREIADGLKHDRASELLSLERSKDDPRQEIVTALEERLKADKSLTVENSETSKVSV